MTRLQNNAPSSNDEPIQRDGVILIAVIAIFAAFATIITAYFNHYRLNIDCQKQQPNDIAICQIVKVNLLKQKTILFDNQPITTINFLYSPLSNRTYSAVNSSVQDKWCKVQLYNDYDAVIWETEHSDRTQGQNCFGYDDSRAFISYLENQPQPNTGQLTHHYQLVIYRPWDRYFLTFFGWAVVGSFIFILYLYIRY